MAAKRGGWYGEPKRHAAAARGIKTKEIRSGEARRRHGLDTSAGSLYAMLRERGLSDFEAQKFAFEVLGFDVIDSPSIRRLIRFSMYGDALDGSGMHITDFEDEDLTNFELRQKYLSLLEEREYETARIVARDMRARKMDVPRG